MDFYLTLEKVSVLFSLIVIGYIVGKFNIVTKSGQKDLTGLVLKVTMPATIIIAMQQPFSSDKVHNILVLIGIFILSYAIMFVSGLALSKLLNKEPANRKDIIRAGVLLSNTSFMGYPIVLSLLGEESLFYAVICGGFVFEIISWTYGVYLIGRNAEGGQAGLKEALLNPGVISIFVGGILFLTGTSIPEPIFSTMKLLGGATSPLAMIVVGLILSRSKMGDAFKDKSIFAVAISKLVINPLLIIGVLRLLNFDGMNIVIPVVLLSMPTAAYLAMFSENSGNDDKFASGIVFVSSLLSLITIPLITALL
ncbi:MAG: AEC family transporter [Bacillota bacterium]|nr:AEC family transporter [Bacillota bacterium]